MGFTRYMGFTCAYFYIMYVFLLSGEFTIIGDVGNEHFRMLSYEVPPAVVFRLDVVRWRTVPDSPSRLGRYGTVLRHETRSRV